ncbi:AraC family transcriptional regulator [Halarcobacter bivalviorum]|uniref:AraC family transcriptional regulator n=1 Tax=Halarcobacter bivalviorum TaxID=663364 RepID=A0AAX2A9D9_9BACT|nr:AraC family transcriptional regulator [Halarcobacter bivalviorum]AXH12582.1 transcriptional regulator, AraC family [Halarcobacter bivalviorum]RXK10494.1 AraC family transcriptional regulator [Halarcobacter bivalviorum]
MDKFIYKNNQLGITALSAKMNKFSYKKHAHEEYALGVTLKGIQEYKLEGWSKASYANGIMLFNPEQVHDGRARDYEEGLEYVMLYINPKLFLEGLNKKEILTFSEPIVYKEKLKWDIINLSKAILNGKNEALTNELYLELVDNFASKDFFKEYKNENTLVKKAKEIIFYELDNVLYLEDIAKELSISKFEFIRLFKTNTGITPYQYFLNSKLIHAKKYLEITRDIYGAVVEFGFSDLSHFNRHFKRVYGLTPFQYISQL